MSDGNWKPGDECPHCLGHGQIDVKVANWKVANWKGSADEGFDIAPCPVCRGVGTLKPLPPTPSSMSETPQEGNS